MTIMRAGVALFITIGIAFPPTGAAATGFDDWRIVAAHPGRFVGQALNFSAGYCGTGGPEGKNPELTQCSFGSGKLFVRSRAVALSRTARVRMKGCGGLDVYEQSPFCRFVVRFVPSGATASAATTGDARIPLLETTSLTLE